MNEQINIFYYKFRDKVNKIPRKILVISLAFFLLLGISVLVPKIYKNLTRYGFETDRIVMEQGTVKKIVPKLPIGTGESAKRGIYTIENKSVAVVTDDGDVYAKTEGVTLLKFKPEKSIKIKFGKDSGKIIKEFRIKIEVISGATKSGISPENVALYEGETQKFKFYNKGKVIKQNGANWSVRDNKIAVIDNTGNLKALSAGSTTILYEIGKKTYYASLVVNANFSDKISLNIESAELNVGDTVVLNLEFPENYNGSKKTKWSSTNSTIASVDGNGIVKAISLGYVVIYGDLNGQLQFKSVIKVKNNSTDENNGNEGQDSNNPVNNDGQDNNSDGDDQKGNNGLNIIRYRSMDFNLMINQPVIQWIEFMTPLKSIIITQTNKNSTYFALSEMSEEGKIKLIDIIGISSGKNTIELKGQVGTTAYVKKFNIFVSNEIYVPLQIIEPTFIIKNGAEGFFELNASDKLLLKGKWKSSNPRVAEVDKNGRVRILGIKDDSCVISFISDATLERVTYKLVLQE
jgi:uncharacterized protein YjdB